MKTMTTTSHLTQKAPPQQVLKLMMLASSNLPIGSYTYSQGVESAIEQGFIHDEASSLAFLQAYQQEVLLNFELPLMASMMHLSAQTTHHSLVDSLANLHGASRDSHVCLFASQQLA